MRSLGLRCNGPFDNVTLDFLLSPLGMGGGGMPDPIGRLVQEQAVHILACLNHPSPEVRESVKQLLAHAIITTRDPLTTYGDDTPLRRLRLLRYFNLTLHLPPSTLLRPVVTPGKSPPRSLCNPSDLSPAMWDLLNAEAERWQYVPPTDPYAGATETPPWQWSPLHIQDSPARTRALLTIMEQDIYWVGVGSHLTKTLSNGSLQPKGTGDYTPAETIQQSRSDDPYLHVTLDIMTAIRYAHGSGETPGVLVMLDGRRITQSFANKIFNVSTVRGRQNIGLTESDS